MGFYLHHTQLLQKPNKTLYLQGTYSPSMFPANYPLPVRSSCQNKLSWQLLENSDPFLGLGFSSPEVLWFYHQEIMYIHHQTKRTVFFSPHTKKFKSCSFYSINSNCSHFPKIFSKPAAQRKWVKFNLHCK